MSESGIPDRNEVQEKPLTPLKAVRKHCLDCASRPKEVRNCSNTACNLYPFRFGHNPSRRRIGPGKIIKRPSVQENDDLMIISQMNGEKIEETARALINVPSRAAGAEISHGLIDLATKGHIRIQRLSGKEIVITLQTGD